MSISRVVLVYDDRPRPETTGVYCLWALRELVEVVHVRPGDWDKIPNDGVDLFINVDDGHEYRLPSDFRPAAWWVIDTHLNLEWDVRKFVIGRTIRLNVPKGSASLGHVPTVQRAFNASQPATQLIKSMDSLGIGQCAMPAAEPKSRR